MKTLSIMMIFFLSIPLWASEPKETFKIFGTEGSYPAMKEASDAFGAANNVKIEIVANNVDQWKQSAQKDSDLIYSSSENVMDNYNDHLGMIDDKSITPLFIRPSVILVRPGNPKKIKGIKDLLHRDLKVVILNGQGQVALWEDIIGRLKDVQALSDFRKRIVFTARTSSEILQYWKNHEDADAWISFSNWGKRDDVPADIVNIEKELTIYRSMGVAVTTITNQRETGLKFIEYLKTAEAEKIFKAHGWLRKEK